MFTRGDPVLLGAGVDLEDVRPRAEYGLLSAKKTERGREKCDGKCDGAFKVRQDFVATFDSCLIWTIIDRHKTMLKK